jgi:hypothetical protein
LLYEPLKKACGKNLFGDEFPKYKKRLCGTLLGLFKTCFDGLETKPAFYSFYSAEIRLTINTDVEILQKKYFRFLDNKSSDENEILKNFENKVMRDEILKNVDKMAHEELIAKFKASYDEFMKEEKNDENVYEFLLIGQRMANMFKTSKNWKKQALAYHQFAINLTIYLNLISRTKSIDGNAHPLRAIAQKWPANLENLVP